MKLLFYSDNCEFCKKLFEYLDKYNIKSMFNLINIDITEVSKDIDMVPTIIDTELNQPLKGKKVFEYLINLKYFNNPTNNIDYIKDLPSNPTIQEDEKANTNQNINLEINPNINLDIKQPSNNINESQLFYETHKNNDISKITNNMVQSRTSQDKKLSLLLQMKRR